MGCMETRPKSNSNAPPPLSRESRKPPGCAGVPAAPARKSRARGAVTFVSDPMFSIAWAPKSATLCRSRPSNRCFRLRDGLAPFWVADCVFSIACGAIRRRLSTAGPLRTRELRFAPDHPRYGDGREPDWALLKTSRHGRPLEPIPVSARADEAPAPNPCRELKTLCPSPLFSVSTRPPEGLKAAAALDATGGPRSATRTDHSMLSDFLKVIVEKNGYSKTGASRRARDPSACAGFFDDRARPYLNGLARRAKRRAKEEAWMFANGLFDGKKILVTGGGTGLGKAMAERFLGLGAEIAICGRRKGVCDEAADELMKAHGGRVFSYGVDIRDAAAVEAMVEAIFREGPLTGLVNNAAGNFISRTEDLSPRGFDAIANIVMHGTFYVTQAVGKRWIAARTRGAVVSIAVTWVRNGGPFVTPSAMSKSAIQAMTMSLAQEWGRYRIRLNAIAPGEIPTEGMSKRLSPGMEPGPPPPRAIRWVAWAESRNCRTRGVPDVGRLRLADRRDDRDGRRGGAGDGRQFLRAAPLGRRRMESGARFDPGAERARQGSARLSALLAPAG